MDAPPFNPGAVPTYKNRRTGLIAFGIVMIVVGCIVALFLPLAFVGQFVGAKSMGIAPNYRALVQTVFVYGLLAVGFIWLGAGSIKARRWARGLLLIVAWSWLVTGFITVIAFLIVMPQIIAGISEGQAMPPIARILMLIVPSAILFCALILLPLGLLLFYSSSHVKATCDALDPVERWTDRAPLPIIGAALWLGFAGLMLLLMTFSARGVVPAFGHLLSGPVGSVVLIVMGVIWLYSAWAIYRVQAIGWWLVTITVVLSTISNLMTFPKTDIGEMYRLMGYADVQIQQMQRFNIVNPTLLTIGSVASSLLLLAYLIWIKRFFPRSTHSGAGTLAAIS